MQNLCSKIDHKIHGSFPVRSQKIMMSDKIINRYTCRHIVHYKEIYLDKTNMHLRAYKLCESSMHVYLSYIIKD